MPIDRDDPLLPDVVALLEGHLADMRATSPPESVHALDPQALSAPGITFWTLREDGRLLGCAALKDLGGGHGELKSMRTDPATRRRGVATRLLVHVLEAAAAGGMQRISLETGTQDFFAPAHRLYRAHGFVPCPPFGDHGDDPNSRYLTLRLDEGSGYGPAPDRSGTPDG